MDSGQFVSLLSKKDRKPMMKVTVCEIRNDPIGLKQDWQALVDHVKFEKSDLVLLPEMPFYEWVPRTDQVDPEVWQQAVHAHDQWMPRLSELCSPIVIGSRPVILNKRHLNEGYIWESTSGYRPAHIKYHLPNEKGFWEASWYERGEGNFKIIQTQKLNIGFLICTELWFTMHARDYARQGIHILVCPRATPKQSVDKWIAGGVTAAVVSGAYCLSSNLSGPNIEGIDFGGAGWIIEPEEGRVLGVTSGDKPFLTKKIDLEIAVKAKHTYPRYVPD